MVRGANEPRILSIMLLSPHTTLPASLVDLTISLSSRVLAIGPIGQAFPKVWIVWRTAAWSLRRLAECAHAHMGGISIPEGVVWPPVASLSLLMPRSREQDARPEGEWWK